jgi:hypothetical protein
MIVLAQAGNAETDGDHIKEGGFVKLHAARAEIGARMKPEFIGAGPEIIAFKNSAVYPAIQVGAGRLDKLRLCGKPPQFYLQPGGRLA